jgi:hypothetical protein
MSINFWGYVGIQAGMRCDLHGSDHAPFLWADRWLKQISVL